MSESKEKLHELSVAVIVPVYKVEGTLEATVKSIQAQTHKNIEIILVDDGSPDNSGAVCDELARKDSRIKVIHQENAGVSAARNAGIYAASSEYICFVDSDDEITYNFVEEALGAICVSEAQLAVCGVSHYYADKTEYIGKTGRVCDYSSLTYDECMGLFSDWIMMLCVGKIFLRRTITENRLKFKEGATCGEDGLFMYNFLRYCDKVTFLDFSAYRYYCFRSNSSNRFFSLETQKDVFNAKKCFLEKHCAEEDVKKYCAKKALGNLRNRFIYMAKKQGDSDGISKAFDYYLPYIIPYIDTPDMFLNDDGQWLAENKSAILNKDGKGLLAQAVKQRKREKRKEYISDFKKMSLKKKIKFLIKKIIG